MGEGGFFYIFGCGLGLYEQTTADNESDKIIYYL